MEKNNEKSFALLISVISIILTVTLYEIFMHNKTMPFPEGWYTYYAQCINSGMMPYRDFEYLFSPVYMYFIAFFTKVFGYEIIYLRVLGIFVFTIIGFLLFFSMRIVFKDWIACIISITATLYLQTEPVQLFYDYIRFMDITALMTLLFFLRSMQNLKSFQHSKNIIVCGFFCSLFILIKQNMGLIFWANILFLLTFAKYIFNIPLRIYLKSLLKFLISCLLPIVFILGYFAKNGTLQAFLDCAGSSAIKAKGGIFAILFNWIFRLGPKLQEMILPIICVICLALTIITLNKYRKTEKTVNHIMNNH